ncbi:MAG: O-antigen ligase family protein [Fibrobacter sp.]|nr:O-antigen ligase family protein [Fibrobacter sp.]
MNAAISKCLIFCLLLVCLIRNFGETQFFPNWFDEFLVISFFFYNILVGKISFKKNNDSFFKNFFVLVVFSVLGAFIGLYHGISELSILYDILDILKIPLFFILLSMINIEKSLFPWIKKTYVLLNIPSVIFGLFQWFMANFKGRYIGLSIYRDRALGARINGFAGHNIALGFAMMVNIIFLLEVPQKKWWHKLLIIGSFCCLLFSQSRIPIALTILYLLYKYVYLKVRRIGRAIIVVLTFLCSVFVLWGAIFDSYSYSQSEEETVRYRTIIQGVNVFFDYPVAGYGLGAYGTSMSVKTMSPFYGDYPDRRATNIFARGATREAFAFQILIETGLMGLFLYYYPFISCAIRARKRKDFDLFYLVSFGFILQSFMNGIYQMPIFFILCFMEGRAKCLPPKSSL